MTTPRIRHPSPELLKALDLLTGPPLTARELAQVDAVGDGIVVKKRKGKKPRAKSPPESQVVKAILGYLTVMGIFAWRSNNQGVFDTKRGQFRTFHGKKGVSDILCLSPGHRVTGDRIGILIAIEAKTLTGKLSVDQKAFLSEVNTRGGVGLVARSLDDVRAMLKAEFDIG